MKLSDAQMKEVSDAVARAESKTSGEIVPMIVSRSSAVGHVPLQVVSLWVVFLFVLDLSFHHYIFDIFSYWWFVGFCILSTIAILFSVRAAFVQRLFLPAVDRDSSVMLRARVEFANLSISATADKTGILIFLSLLERECVVLADAGIASKLPPETWQVVVDQVLAGVKSGEAASGLVKAIGTCGDLLAAHFKVKTGDVNELPNSLVVKD